MLLQISLPLVFYALSIEATPPPGFVKSPEEADKNPPNYEYGYNIEDNNGQGQGKLETREGVHGRGRYYVQGSGSNQNVEYVTDDWGFHPLVEYSSVGPHSRSSTKLVLGEEAIRALNKNDTSSPSAEIKDAIEQGNEKNREDEGFSTPQMLEQDFTSTTLPDYVETDENQNAIQDDGAQTLSKPETVHDISNSGHLISLVQEHITQLQSEEKKSSSVEVEPQFILTSSEELRPYETSALFENSGNKLVKSTDYDEAVANLQRLGEFGKKLGVKIPIAVTSQKTTPIRRKPSHLIESTQNLVSGQDVLSINGAVSQVVSTTTERVYSTIHTTQTTVDSIASALQEVTQHTHPLTNTLSQQPIVVEEFEEETPTTAATIQRTSESFGDTTVLVTPRPVQNEQKAVDVQVQKSVPYYLGKFEYPMPYAYQEVTHHDGKNKTSVVMENFQLGNVLLNFPVPSIPAEMLNLEAPVSVQELLKFQTQQLPVASKYTSFKDENVLAQSSAVGEVKGDQESSMSADEKERQNFISSEQELPHVGNPKNFKGVPEEKKQSRPHAEKVATSSQEDSTHAHGGHDHHIHGVTTQLLPHSELTNSFKDLKWTFSNQGPSKTAHGSHHHEHPHKPSQGGYHYSQNSGSTLQDLSNQEGLPEEQRTHSHHHNHHKPTQGGYHYTQHYTLQDLPNPENVSDFKEELENRTHSHHHNPQKPTQSGYHYNQNTGVMLQDLPNQEERTHSYHHKPQKPTHGGYQYTQVSGVTLQDLPNAEIPLNFKEEDRTQSHHHKPQKPIQTGYHYSHIGGVTLQDVPNSEKASHFRQDDRHHHNQGVATQPLPQYGTFNSFKDVQWTFSLQEPQKTSHGSHHHHHHHKPMHTGSGSGAYHYGHINGITKQELPHLDISNDFKETDLQEASNQRVQVPTQLLVDNNKFVTTPYPVPTVQVSYPVEKPVPYVVVKQHYPVEVRLPVQVPAAVDQKLPPSAPISQPYYLPFEAFRLPPVSFSKYNAQPPLSPPPRALASQNQNYQFFFGGDQLQTQQQLHPQFAFAPQIRPQFDQENAHSLRNAQFASGYIGMVPPKVPNFRNVHYLSSYRKARSNVGSNVKLEYGFLPPMVPSLEIDEHGNPVNKDEK